MARDLDAFAKTVWDYYRAHGRHDLPWRLPRHGGHFDPYKIMVSEIMLQQTQVPRVLPKFAVFTAQFPTFAALADAPLGDVLQAWSGLGYNRRAKFLWQAAQMVQQEFGGEVPQTVAELVKLPGIGPNTAGAVLAYSFNKPVMFIETNIRTVFIHHFFGDDTSVHDRDIADLVAQTVPDNAREWYWALMDYGTFLKQTVGNLNRNSAHYTVQSKFEGSRRQIRGKVLRTLGTGAATEGQLAQSIADERLQAVLTDLLAEGLVQRQGAYYKLPGA